MKLEQWSESDRMALREFYETGQSWTWAEIAESDSSLSRSFRPWIEESPPPRANPLLLPARLTGVTDSSWFALAFSSAQAEALREELNAFLGPVGSDYRGRRADSADDHPLLRVAMEWAGGPWVFHFTPLPNQRSQVRMALERLRAVWRLRPARQGSLLRTTDALLREFFAALVNRDPIASARWVAEIYGTGRLSAENLQFLEIERLGALGFWDQLVLHPRIALLATMRRPRRVTGLLVEAFWRVELSRFMDEGKASEAIDYFRERFLPQYAGLVRARGVLNAVGVVMMFLLAAVAGNPPRREQIPVLLALVPPDAPERAFAEKIAALTGPSETIEPSDPLARARRALGRKDFDSAWQLARAAGDGAERVEILLDCATELLDPDVAQIVAQALRSLSSAETEGVLRVKRHARTWSEVQALLAAAGKPEPKDWETWLSGVEADPNAERALESARSAVGTWDYACYAGNQPRTLALAQTLQVSRSKAAAAIVRLALPQLAQFFLPDGRAQRFFCPIYGSLLLVLAVDDSFGGEDWALAQTLATAVLEGGGSAADYEAMVEALTAIWQSHGEIGRLDWALDGLDALVVAAAPAPKVRDDFFHAIWQTFNGHARRIKGPHRELFRLLSLDLGRQADYAALSAAPLPVPGQATTEQALDEVLRDKIVGIYSLTESAALRAKAVIQEQFADVDVRLNHDFGGTNRLEALAKESDYLLVVAKSAKHAATDFIKQKRPRTKSEIIYPSGKGSSSIVTALLRATGYDDVLA